MSQSLPTRGAVVTRRGDRAVVWIAWPDRFLLLPIIDRPDALFGPDVPIESSADRMTCCAMGDAVIRCGTPVSVPSDGQVSLGRVSDQLLAQVSLAVVRAQREASFLSTWRGERTDRARRFEERTALR